MGDLIWKEVMEYYDSKCVRCGNKATSVHELIPRSLAPNNWNTFDNRVPLCNECHSWAEERTAYTATILREKVAVHKKLKEIK
jgi:5-methylcytosine-specific restriction endonuclease McrA